MKTLVNKLRSRAGETLVEAMAAILVFTLASVLLFTMVSSANQMNKKALLSDAALSRELNVAEQKQAVESVGSVSLIIGNSSVKSYPVNLYRASQDAVYSYSVKTN